MSETKTLQERLRAEAAKIVRGGPIWAEGETTVIIREAADALDAKDSLLREARDVLGPFCERPNDWTVDQVNHARAFLLKLAEAQK